MVGLGNRSHNFGAIIKSAEQWSDGGRNLDVGQCSHPNCRYDVGIELIEEGSK